MKYLFAVTISLFATLSTQVQAKGSASFKPLISAEPSCETGDNSCVVLQESQSFDLADWGALDFVGIAEDSRCPLDAVCFWQGRVRVLMKHQNLTMSQKFEVGLGGNLESQWIDERTGLTLRLQQVWPEKLLSAPSDQLYQIKLKIKAFPNETATEQDQDESTQQTREYERRYDSLED
ncbi:MAG: hypothetical protein H7318_03225 [Oligoflexus sp.]|nr:hypothetical protein [Oligoflexus sp.]